MKYPPDRVQLDIARHEKEIDQAQELFDQAQELFDQAQIDEMMDTVWSEVHEGEHDDELSQSSWLQLDTAMRIARTAACSHKTTLHAEVMLGDLHDLYLQITDYVRDVAEMRLAR